MGRFYALNALNHLNRLALGFGPRLRARSNPGAEQVDVQARCLIFMRKVVLAGSLYE
jgi:hypothetical protein